MYGETLRLLTRYGTAALAVVAGLEWLLGRTVSRLAASPVLEGTPRDLVETAGRTGLNLVAPTFALALVLLLIFAVDEGARATARRDRLVVLLALLVVPLAGMAVAAWFVPDAPWYAVVFHAVTTAVMLVAALVLLRSRAAHPAFRLAVLLSFLGYALRAVDVTGGSGLDGLANRLVLDLPILLAGEALLLAAAFLFFVGIALPEGRWRHARRWVVPLVLALTFSAGSIVDAMTNQAFTGVFALWSIGYTLYLPWPVYALALALYAYAVLTCFAKGAIEKREANPNTGVGLLLLVFAGYALQLTHQHLLAALAFLLLCGVARPFRASEPWQPEAQGAPNRLGPPEGKPSR